MGLIDQIRKDMKVITSDLSGFGVTMILTAPTGEILTLSGLHSKHHLGIDMQTGGRVNSKNAHVSFAESVLTENGYPVRNSFGEISLKNHRVSVPDNTGINKLYIIREWFPSETTGLIVCILGDFE